MLLRQRAGIPEDSAYKCGLAALKTETDWEGWTCQTLEGQIPLGQKAGEEMGATCVS